MRLTRSDAPKTLAPIAWIRYVLGLRRTTGLLAGVLSSLALSSCWPTNVSRIEFAARLLTAIGAPTSESNVRVMVAWMQAEGGSCQWNPINTTQPASGAWNCNHAGVKEYPDADSGLNAEVQTLLNGLYRNVVADFRSSADPLHLTYDICHSRWGTGCPLLESTVSEAFRNDTAFKDWANKLVAGSH